MQSGGMFEALKGVSGGVFEANSALRLLHIRARSTVCPVYEKRHTLIFLPTSRSVLLLPGRMGEFHCRNNKGTDCSTLHYSFVYLPVKHWTGKQHSLTKNR